MSNLTTACKDGGGGSASPNWESLEMNTAFIVVSLVSMVVSFLNILVWSRVSTFSLKDMFLSLEVANFIYVLIYLPVRIINLYFSNVKQLDSYVYFYWVSSHYCMWSVIFTGLVSMSVGVWRFIAVAWPLKANVILTMTKAKVVVLVCCVLALVPTIFHATTFVRREKCDSAPEDAPILQNYGSKMRPWVNENGTLIVYVWLTIYILYYLLPSICFLLVYAFIIMILIRRRYTMKHLGTSRDKENRTTITIGFLMAGYLISYPGLTILFIFRVQEFASKKATHLSPIYQFLFPSGFLLLVVNCFSFLAYYQMCGKFRSTARSLAQTVIAKKRKKSIVSRTLSDQVSFWIEPPKVNTVNRYS